MVAAHLSKDLKEKYNRRSLSIRKGDRVTVMRGAFIGIAGEVLNVNRENYKIYVEGITQKKADGTDVPRFIDPSNVLITELFIEDKERRNILERKIE